MKTSIILAFCLTYFFSLSSFARIEIYPSDGRTTLENVKLVVDHIEFTQEPKSSRAIVILKGGGKFTVDLWLRGADINMMGFFSQYADSGKPLFITSTETQVIDKKNPDLLISTHQGSK